jgi:hypothetical protein
LKLRWHNSLDFRSKETKVCEWDYEGRWNKIIYENEKQNKYSQYMNQNDSTSLVLLAL